MRHASCAGGPICRYARDAAGKVAATINAGVRRSACAGGVSAAEPEMCPETSAMRAGKGSGGGAGRGTGGWGWLRRLLPQRQRQAPELLAAEALLRAIDRGGIPLNPAKVNAIARDFGLEVSPKAPLAETIERIRAAVARARG